MLALLRPLAPSARKAIHPARGPNPLELSTRATLAVALLVLGVFGCKSSQSTAPPPNAPLPLVASYALGLSEPSDLAIDETGTILWTVTNNPDSVYQLDLTGKRVKTLKYAGQDLEGITYDRSDQTLWVAEENRREVVHLDLDGNVLSRKQLSLTGEVNSGLEGICLDDAGRMFLLNEKNPGLFIQLDPALSIAAKDTLYFAGDYSGLSYQPGSASFWIVSDQSQRLYRWSKTLGVLKEYGLPYSKAEGVAFDPATNLVYIVSDLENKLYVYQYSP